MQCVKKNVGQLNSITDAALRPDKDTTLLAKAEILDHVTTHEKGFCPVGLSRSEKRSRAVGIGVHRAVVVGNVVTLLDGLAQGKGYGRREDWSIVTKGVVLAVLAIGVGTGRQGGHKTGIDRAPHSGGSQAVAHRGNDDTPQAGSQEMLHHHRRGRAPKRLDNLYAMGCQLLFAVAPHVVQVYVAIDKPGNAKGLEVGNGTSHGQRVVGHIAPRRQVYHIEGQAYALGLRLQQRQRYMVHGREAGVAVDRREQGQHLITLLLHHPPQSVGRVFAATPIEYGFFHRSFLYGIGE